MFRQTLVYSVLCAVLLLWGCGSEGGGDESNLGSSSSALTAEEQAALDSCLEEVKSCRLSDDPRSRECTEIYACLPDRPVDDGAGEEDAQRFCEAVEERCSQSEMDAEACDALMERCMSDRIRPDESGEASEGVERPQPTAEECLADCLESGGDEARCSQRCSELD